MLLEIALILLLILLNGLFAMSEIAIVSARKAHLQTLVRRGNKGARAALLLQDTPGIFLSTIQIGITMAGILSGAIGEKILINPLASWLNAISMPNALARPLATVMVIAGLTYVSVVIGELVPKRLGLLEAERIASRIARPMQMLACLGKPLVALLASSSGFLLRILGLDQPKASSVNNEEIRVMMKEGAETGVFHESEQVLVANILRLDEQSVVSIMTHRNNLYILDLEAAEAEIRKRIADCPFSRIIVCRQNLQEIAGLLRVADLLPAALAGGGLQVEQKLRPPMYVSEYMSITEVLESFRKDYLQCALVVDEYGTVQGMVTLNDVVGAIVGDIHWGGGSDASTSIRCSDGSWLLDGSLSIEKLKDLLKLQDALPEEKNNAFHTLGGFAICHLGKIPQSQDGFEFSGYRFQVYSMDHNRIAKILVRPLAPEPEETTVS